MPHFHMYIVASSPGSPSVHTQLLRVMTFEASGTKVITHNTYMYRCACMDGEPGDEAMYVVQGYIHLCIYISNNLIAHAYIYMYVHCTLYIQYM